MLPVCLRIEIPDSENNLKYNCNLPQNSLCSNDPIDGKGVA